MERSPLDIHAPHAVDGKAHGIDIGEILKHCGHIPYKGVAMPDRSMMGRSTEVVHNNLLHIFGDGRNGKTDSYTGKEKYRHDEGEGGEPTRATLNHATAIVSTMKDWNHTDKERVPLFR